ncbi:hypothetical protein ACTXG6_11710 [Pseudonocardia sp. Cha107L01]|uniref:hypothetical protein n=1 Tax=Pseudonocardia sp. Cha107L01 TaxID=3457576 RepID=UPI00403EB808
MAEGVGHLCEMSGLHNKRVSDAWQRVGSWLTRDYDNVIDDEGLPMNTGRPADRTTPHSAPRAVPGEGATQP